MMRNQILTFATLFFHFCAPCNALDDDLSSPSASSVRAQQQRKATCRPSGHAVVNPYPDPDPPAPESFRVKWRTTAPKRNATASAPAAAPAIILEVVRKWSPRGVDRFHSLVRDNFYDCAAFFRVVPGTCLSLNWTGVE
jgi:hypothetical protein